MKIGTLEVMVLLLGATGVAGANESTALQNGGLKNGDMHQVWSHTNEAWSHDASSDTRGTATVARVTADHEVVATSRSGENRANSAAPITAAVARVAEDGGHGDVLKSHDGSEAVKWSHGVNGSHGVNASHGVKGSHGVSSHALEAPEIDSGTLVIALTLLLGALAVLGAPSAANKRAGKASA